VSFCCARVLRRPSAHTRSQSVVTDQSPITYSVSDQRISQSVQDKSVQLPFSVLSSRTSSRNIRCVLLSVQQLPISQRSESVSDQRISQAVRQSVTYEDIAFGDGVHVNGSLILHLPDTHLTHHTPHTPHAGSHLTGSSHLLRGGLLLLLDGDLLGGGGARNEQIRLNVVLRGPQVDGTSVALLLSCT